MPAPSRSASNEATGLGFDLLAIRQNLGHAEVKTTLGYIGELDAGKRRPPSIYPFDLKSLDGFDNRQRPDGLPTLCRPKTIRSARHLLAANEIWRKNVCLDAV